MSAANLPVSWTAAAALLALAACTPPEPAGPAPSAPAAPPASVPAAATPDPSKAEPAAPSKPAAPPTLPAALPDPTELPPQPVVTFTASRGSAEYDPGDRVPPKVPRGVVPAELTDGLIELEHPFPSPLLRQPDGCLDAKSDQDCFWDVPTIVGFSAGRGEVAFLHVPHASGASDRPEELLGERLLVADGAAKGHENFGAITPEDPKELMNTPLRARVRSWIDGLKRDGFVGARDLVAFGGAVRDRGAIAFPLAVLDAPMTGWMLYAPPAEDGDFTLKLVAPDNKSAFTIGRMADRKPKDSSKRSAVTFSAVQLDPSRKHLLILVSQDILGQNEESWLEPRLYTLPPIVQTALPKR